MFILQINPPKRPSYVLEKRFKSWWEAQDYAKVLYKNCTFNIVLENQVIYA